jgi:hypothetical protein
MSTDKRNEKQQNAIFYFWIVETRLHKMKNSSVVRQAYVCGARQADLGPML